MYVQRKRVEAVDQDCSIRQPEIGPNMHTRYAADMYAHIILTSHMLCNDHMSLKGGNKERDRRLQVVKLLPALSYCVGSSFFFWCSSISFRTTFTVKRCG